MARYGRVTFSISYVVDLDDAEMVDEAREMIVEDIQDSFRYRDSWAAIDVQPDATATEEDIADFLIERRDDRRKEREHAATLAIDHEQAARLQALLDGPATDCGRDECIFDREVVFSDGRRMAIQVIAPNAVETDSCWCQGVLFGPEGAELGCTEPGDTLTGEYRVDVEDEDGTHTYTTMVAVAVAVG